MFIVNKPSPAGTRTAFNIAEAPNLSIVLDTTVIGIYVGNQRVLDNEGDASVTAESLINRFNDLLEAFNADAKVYDLAQPVGAWKPKPKHTPRKTAPKKEAS